MGRFPVRRFPWPAAVVLASLVLLLGGCAEKAKTLQIGAAQFKAESLAAIDRIDDLRRKETAVTPPPEADQVRLFADAVLKSTKPIGAGEVKVLSDLFRTHRVANDEAWQEFLGGLRNQYTTFDSVFASLDKGSLLAAPAVDDTLPTLDKLIAQLVAFADSTKKAGAEFTRERAAIAADLMTIRDNENLPEPVKRSMLAGVRSRLLDVVEAERQATRTVIEQCLKAAIVGRKLRELIANYGRVSLDDIASGLTQAIALSSQLTGRDLSSISARADSIIGEIKADPQLAGLFDTALGTLQKARSTP